MKKMLIAMAAMAVIGMGAAVATDPCVSTFTNVSAGVGTAIGGPVAGVVSGAAGFMVGELVCPNSELNSGN